MKRRRHWSIWAGLVLALAGVFTMPYLTSLAATRDYAWANFLMLAAATALLCFGTLQPFRLPAVFRGKILGSILSVVGVAFTGLFAYGVFFLTRVPAGGTALAVGQPLPDFTLTDEKGSAFTKADLLSTPGAGDAAKALNGALLIFYRGFW